MSTTKKEIKATFRGQNVSVTIDGERHARRIAEKTIRDEIKTLIEGYNKRNSKAKLAKILKLVEKPVKQTKAEKAESLKREKAVKDKQAKKAVSDKTAKKAEKIKKEVKAKPVARTRSPYRGEY